ncbi:DUF3606 domain-containing protein [Tahibacter amnicola]|uniref:DUF3606 domain-containing protein n=1 Tax=Tahibacter amnicola TaxID=2976241 RepID=A0ABY6BIK4_9GAMM|nr:DUF3606 domain-containing protein [Tahibacter amnicola]UXI69846.1 DUF3606 domain-containing protein [Tahibacter amnicola]
MSTAIERSEATSSERIDLTAPWELSYWATRWRVSTEELLSAAAEVGTVKRVLKAYLSQGPVPLSTRPQ